MAIGFQLTESKKTEYDEYIGQYVVLHGARPDPFVGRVEAIKEGQIILNPFRDWIADSDSSCLVAKLIDDNDKGQKIRLGTIVSVTPTTKRNIKASCNDRNNYDQMDREMKIMQYRQSRVNDIKLTNLTGSQRNESYFDGAGI